MKPSAFTPVTDGEVRHALSVLKRFPAGLTRQELARHFQSDRRGREIMATLAEKGIAPVINTKSDFTDDRVYRLARTSEEVAEAVSNLKAYRSSLDRRIRGLEKAWADGGGARQPDLFQVAI